jgi:hypothetical protein
MDAVLLDFNAPSLLLLAVATLVLAYMVFSLVGFGSGLLASAPLAMVMPVARVVPLLAMLDCVGSATRGFRAGQAVDRSELYRLLPSMLFGQVAGVLALAWLPLRVMAVLLGVFVAVQGWHGLRCSPAAGRKEKAGWLPTALAIGLFGGFLGGLFGSGGFVYASYLERRLERNAFRATQAVLIAVSTAWRVLLCSLAGLIDGALLGTVLLLAPAAYAGMWLGRHLDLRLSREQLFALLNGLLVLSGLALMLRSLG